MSVFKDKVLLITGGTGSFRERRVAEVPRQRHQGDSHLFARREEAG